MYGTKHDQVILQVPLVSNHAMVRNFQERLLLETDAPDQLPRSLRGGNDVFSSTAIALRSSAIVKVSGQKTTHHVVAVGCSGVPWVYSFKVSLDFRELEFGTDFSP